MAGWEGRVDIGENGRRSEGTRPRYFFGERRTTEGPSEGMKNAPIIEVPKDFYSFFSL
jgi:hypothetical protein